MSWQVFIKQEQKEQYLKDLSAFIQSERTNGDVYPPPNDVFNAFKLCPIEQTKVVILGQDPYHGIGQANGLAFSVNEGIAIPPSLRNIFLEIHQNLGLPIPENGNLMRWATQGVLLLNDVLTVKAGMAGSHQKKGWETFTEKAIKKVSDECNAIVFMLWGAHAQKKKHLIDDIKHLVLVSGHPSPMSANQGKWFGNRHFEKANNFLIANGKMPINW